jgi:hypothetical protein
MIRKTIANVGNRTIDSRTFDLTVEEARETYAAWDAKYRRVSRTVTKETVIFYWIDRAEGNLPGVGCHMRLYIPAELVAA